MNKYNMQWRYSSWSVKLCAAGFLLIGAAWAASQCQAEVRPSVQLRMVENELQIGTDVARPFYVQWRTPATPWQTWNEGDAIPPEINGFWMRGVFPPDEVTSWDIPDDTGQLVSPALPDAVEADGQTWVSIASMNPDGAVRAVAREPIPEVMTSESELPADDNPPTRNNQARGTPDPGRLKVYWHNSSTRYVAAWNFTTNGALKSSGFSNEGAMSVGWVLSGVGDINQDGYSDLIWYNSSSRQVAYWMMAPDGYIESSGLCTASPMSAGWMLRAVGDVDRDGSADIIWHSSTSKMAAYWMLNADGTLKSSGLCTNIVMSDGWSLNGSGDIDGDGTMDLLWHNTITKKVAYWFLNDDGTLRSAGFCYGGVMTDGWELRGTGDIKGDGSLGVFWHNAITKKVAYWFLKTDGTVDGSGFCFDGTMTSGWELKATGDLNNDGTVDVLWHNAITKKVAYWLMKNDGTVNTSGFATDATMSSGWEIRGAGF